MVMDNFNLLLDSVEGPISRPNLLNGMRSTTIWTTAANTSNFVNYFHTQLNRRVRYQSKRNRFVT
jgi:choloylglycine hydrolase